jgi:hypothetical protein
MDINKKDDTETLRTVGHGYEGATTITLDFTPNKPQTALLQSFKRFNIFECHRGAGKTYIALWILLSQALKNPYSVDGRYALLAPVETQVKRNSAKILVDMCMQIPEAVYYKSEKRIQLPNGVEIFMLGLKDHKKIKGTRWDGVVIDEFALLDDAELFWNETLMPSLMRWDVKSRKGWVLITTTPPTRKHYYTELYDAASKLPDWNVQSFPVSISGCYTESEIAAYKATMNPSVFAIEMECSHDIPTEGAYFMDSMLKAIEQKRINATTKYDSRLDVTVSIDLGIDGTAMWFAQEAGHSQINLIDYYQDLSTDKKIGYFINYLKGLPYRYNAIYLPHDSNKGNLQTTKTILDEFVHAFGKTVVRLKREPIDAGIYRTNTEFYRCHFNAEACREGINALREFCPKKDSTKTSFTKKIDHNWASHGADAFRYLIKGLVELPPSRFSTDSYYRPTQKNVEHSTVNFDPF